MKININEDKERLLNNLHYRNIKDEIFIFILQNTDTHTQTYVWRKRKYDDVLYVWSLYIMFFSFYAI